MLRKLAKRRRRHRFISHATDRMNFLLRCGSRCIGGCGRGSRRRVRGWGCCATAIYDADKAPTTKKHFSLKRLVIGSGEMSCGTDDEEGKGTSSGCEGWSCHRCFFLGKKDDLLGMGLSDSERWNEEIYLALEERRIAKLRCADRNWEEIDHKWHSGELHVDSCPIYRFSSQLRMFSDRTLVFW